MISTEILPYGAVFLLSIVYILLKRRRIPPPPGPFSLPIIGHLHLLGPRLHHTFHNLAQKYGPLIQLHIGSLPCVVVSSPQIAREFLKTHEHVFSARPLSTAVNIVTYNSSFAFSPYDSYWKYIKKLCVYQLLGVRNLNHFEPVRALEIRSFLKLLMKKGESGEAVNISSELMNLTGNVISHMMLSIRCSKTEDEAAAARTVTREVTEIFGEFNVSDAIWFCKNFDVQGIRKRAEDIHRRYDALLEKIIREREEVRRREPTPAAASDFLDMLMDEMEKGKSEVEFTRNHLKSLILDFFTAGTDTSAGASEWAIAEIINNPNVLKKIQQEIHQVIGSNRLVMESDTQNLPYLNAVIKETFRLHPPIPMLNRKSIEECVINGYKIPANCILFVNIWSMGRNPDIWENPLSFRPERFLESSIDVKGQHFELLPFGTGRRGCPGMMMVLPEMVSILGNMVHCFDWKLTGGSQTVDMSERPGLAAPRQHDLICNVIPRIDHEIVFGS